MLNPVLSSTWRILIPGTTELENPVIFPEEGVHVQVNCVPATFEVRVMLVLRRSHCDFAGGELVRTGVGNTVTV